MYLSVNIIVREVKKKKADKILALADLIALKGNVNSPGFVLLLIYPCTET